MVQRANKLYMMPTLLRVLITGYIHIRDGPLDFWGMCWTVKKTLGKQIVIFYFYVDARAYVHTAIYAPDSNQTICSAICPLLH